MDEAIERIPDIIEIRDSEIDVEAIVAQIRENIRQRRGAHPELFGLELPTFAVGEPLPDGATGDDALAYNLRQATVAADEIGVMMSPVKSSLPLLGPLWTAVKRQMHGLVLYYVNTLAGKQMKFNHHVVRVLQQQEQELESLRDRIEQIEQLEQTAGQPET